MASYHTVGNSSKGRRRSSPSRFYTDITAPPSSYRYRDNAVVYPEEYTSRRPKDSKRYQNYDHDDLDRRVEAKQKREEDEDCAATVRRGRRKSILKRPARFADDELRGPVQRLRSKSRARFRDDASVIDDSDDEPIREATRSGVLRGRPAERPVYSLLRSKSHRRKHDEDADAHELEKKTNDWNRLFRDKRSTYESEEAGVLRSAASGRQQDQHPTSRRSRRDRGNGLIDDDDYDNYRDIKPKATSRYTSRRGSNGTDRYGRQSEHSNLETARYSRGYSNERDDPPRRTVTPARTRSPDRNATNRRDGRYDYGRSSGERLYRKGRDGLVDAMQNLRT